MSTPSFARWLASLRAGADQPPLRPRVPLWAGTAQIGSVEPGFLSQIGPQRLFALREVLHQVEREGLAGWQLGGDPTVSLALLAGALRDAGLAHVWRNEQLAVPDADGHVVATIERAVIRVLGTSTRAVHLVGTAPDGRIWLQQRAFSKPNDPGLWDTLMGGMVSAADTLDSALERETWEEAGLHLHELQAVRYGGQVTTRRPADDGGGAGYVVEHIDWFACTVPEGMAPANQDGEVERFALVVPSQLPSQLEQNLFTAEAALILAAYLNLG